jgi:hypothetical protein
LAMLAVPALSAQPRDASVLFLRSLPEGVAAPAGFSEAPLIAIPIPAPMFQRAAQDTRSVDMTGLLDRHLRATDSYMGAAGAIQISGTLDLNGDGYLAVSPPDGPATLVKIERGMSGSWRSGGVSYSVSLSVSIFRPRLANWIVVKDHAGRVVWERRISDLFRLTYGAGEPVTIGGRVYALFYSHLPDTSARPIRPSARRGLCFIYEDTSSGTREYKFYLIPVEQIQGPNPTSYKMYDGDAVRLLLSPDGSRLELSR